ncbi:Uncharacterized WD repeat-containing protein alr2800 [Durusdinium trenchii]|uniref:WD40 repeat-containing protein SMU1 n=1 Tax=Durusdinium trenchii TaxID=1381693 RepID=A0ABP0RSE6_9DINO
MALLFACEIGDLEQVRSLVLSCEVAAHQTSKDHGRHGAETNSDRATGIHPGRRALQAQPDQETSEETSEHAQRRLVNACEPKKGRTALIAAISQGHFAVADFLLNTGANPSSQAFDGVDALMCACQLHSKNANHNELVQLLLFHGASVENQDKAGRTALHIAAKRGCQGAVKELLAVMTPAQRATLVDRRDNFGMTPLMLSSGRGHSNITAALCAAGANANLVDNRQNSALHWAARSGKADMVSALISHGATVSQKDRHGLTSLSIAAALGHIEFLQAIHQLEAVPLEHWNPGTAQIEAHGSTKGSSNEQLCIHRTPLLLAASNGHLRTVHMLVSHRFAAQQQLAQLAPELEYAKYLAVLGCHDEVNRFLSGLFPLPETLQGCRRFRFRIVCACATCETFYLESQTSDSRNTGGLPAGQGFTGDLPTMSLSAPLLSAAVDSIEGSDSRGSTVGATVERAVTAREVHSSDRSVGTVVPTGDDALWSPGNGASAGGPSRQQQQRSSSALESGAAAGRRHRRTRGPGPEKQYDPGKIFDPEDPGMKNDILRIIGTYLQDEGFSLTSLTLQDEAQIKLQKRSEMNDKAQKIYHAISHGDWSAVLKLSTKALLGRNYRRLLYAVHKQEFLELIFRGENERAFSFLHKKLKPLEAQSKVEANASEFLDLCYLLTCKSVHDAPSFRDWDMALSRDKLAEDFKSMVTTEFNTAEASLVSRQVFVEKNRLIHLFQQAVAYQLEFTSHRTSEVTPRIETLLEDFERVGIPERLTNTFVGHPQSVKCVRFLGDDGRLIASGSSDRTIMIWRVQNLDDGSGSDSEDAEDDDHDDHDEIMDTFSQESDDAPSLHTSTRSGQAVIPDARRAERPRIPDDSPQTGGGLGSANKSHHTRQYKQRGPEMVLEGHDSRIWDLASDPSGRWLVSASGDSTLRLWDVWSCLERSQVRKPSVELAASLEHVRIDPGHQRDVYGVEFQNDRMHVATAGYDRTVRLVNINTNQVVRVFRGHGAAVTQVKFNPLGNLIISVSKDSTIKFWDTISGVCVRSLHQPVGEVTSLDVSRDGLHVLSSSKDSSLRLWDVRTGRPFRRFGGFQNSSLNFVRACFGPREALIFSGSEDAKVHVWDTESSDLLAKLRGHTGPVFHTAWNRAQGLLATCSEDSTIRTWR